MAECDLAEVRGLGFGDERIPLLSGRWIWFAAATWEVLIDSTTPQDTLAAHRVASGVSGVRTTYCGAMEAMRALRAADRAADLHYGHLAGVLDADLVRRLRRGVPVTRYPDPRCTLGSPTRRTPSGGGLPRAAARSR